MTHGAYISACNTEENIARFILRAKQDLVKNMQEARLSFTPEQIQDAVASFSDTLSDITYDQKEEAQKVIEEYERRTVSDDVAEHSRAYYARLCCQQMGA